MIQPRAMVANIVQTLMRLVMGMASRVLDNSLRADSMFFVGDGC